MTEKWKRGIKLEQIIMKEDISTTQKNTIDKILELARQEGAKYPVFTEDGAKYPVILDMGSGQTWKVELVECGYVNL
jgi:hypothetical protein